MNESNAKLVMGRSYNKVAEGPDWEMYSIVDHSDTKTMNMLHGFAMLEVSMCFSGIEGLIRQRYDSIKRINASKNITISAADGIVEVFNSPHKKLFPRFYFARK